LQLAKLYREQVLSKLSTLSPKIRTNNEAVVILCYRCAIRFDPNLSEAHYQLGGLLAKQGKWQEAAASFRQTIESNYPYPSCVYFNLGRMLLKLRKYEESIPCFRSAIEYKHRDYWCYIYLGNALSEIGEISETVKIYQTAIQKKISNTHPNFKPQLHSTQPGSAPHFIIIGQAKCGTTSLYSYLTQHPQILPALLKEINFWQSKSNFPRGLDWYLSYFIPIGKETNFITGEATTRYLDSPEAAQRLVQVFPKMKLIVLLRNPVNRAISEYYMFFRTGSEKRSLKTAVFAELEALTQQREIELNELYYLSPSVYINSISRWMELFPQEQFLILRSEDLFADPDTTVNQVFQFLGVEPYQLQEYPKKNSGNYPPISQSMHRTLSDYFRPYNQQLEEYLDRKFNWDSDT